MFLLLCHLILHPSSYCELWDVEGYRPCWFSTGYLYLMLQTMTGVLRYLCSMHSLSAYTCTLIAGPLHINTRYHINVLSGIQPTEAEVTSFQLNAKRMLYLQATTAGQ